MSILIIGDSQAAGAGAVLAERLGGAALKTQSGASIEGVIGLAKSLASLQFDRVIIFAGGNGIPKEESVRELLSIFPGAEWVGPPPATRILDLQSAKTKFGGKVDGPNFWFQDGTAASRENKNNFLKVAVTEAGGKYHDWRKFGLAGDKQPSGVTFPNQPDGIHVSNQTAKLAFANGIPTNWLEDNVGILVTAGILGIVGYKMLRG